MKYKLVLECTTNRAFENANILFKDMFADKLTTLGTICNPLTDNAHIVWNTKLTVCEMLFLIFASEDHLLDNLQSNGGSVEKCITKQDLDEFSELQPGCSCEGCFGKCLDIAFENNWIQEEVYDFLQFKHYELTSQDWLLNHKSSLLRKTNQ